MLALTMLGATPAAAIMAGSASGSQPDSPADRVDANTTSSTWAGVGSLSVGSSAYGAVAIGQRYVLTAAHVAKGANPASVKFSLNYGSSLSHQIPAAAVFAHPAFVSFNNPDAQHDIAIIELAQDIPPGVPIYPLHFADVPAGTTLVMVGYGSSGQGDVGASVGGNPGVKRVGSNNADTFVPDADGSGRHALFMFDFDGGTAPSSLGGPTLGNRIETSFASGDSGSPSFVFAGGQWKVAGINTFIFTFDGGPTALSTFGTGGGGNLVWPYQAWINGILDRPGNDTFANRFALAAAGGMLSGSSVGATKQVGEPNHAGNPGGKSVWWTWTAPQDGEVSIDTHGSGFDTLLAVYTGTAVDTLTLIAASDNDGSGGNASGVTFTAKAGTEYRIAVDGVGGASGDMVLRWGDPAAASAQIPVLPGWGVVLLGLALVAVAARLHVARRPRG
jgi:hypothetical protein